jgi:hypothetical protein
MVTQFLKRISCGRCCKQGLIGVQCRSADHLVVVLGLYSTSRLHGWQACNILDGMQHVSSVLAGPFCSLFTRIIVIFHTRKGTGKAHANGNADAAALQGLWGR